MQGVDELGIILLQYQIQTFLYIKPQEWMRHNTDGIPWFPSVKVFLKAWNNKGNDVLKEIASEVKIFMDKK